MADAAIAGTPRGFQEKTGTPLREPGGTGRAGARMTRGAVRVNLALAIFGVLMAPTPASCWGPAGHAIVARAALAACDDLPAWFRGAEDALADLANAPDRWREAE